MLGIAIPERVTGVDLMLNLVKKASEKSYKLYFLGAKKEVVKKLVEMFKIENPDLQIVGYRNGYFSQSEEKQVVEEIKNSGADILFVGVSSPKKKFFLNKYAKYMEVPFVMGLGGSFNVVAGYVRRAPIWMRRAGLEWLYRLNTEPRRMWKRYLTTNTIFLGMVLKALITGKRIGWL